MSSISGARQRPEHPATHHHHLNTHYTNVTLHHHLQYNPCSKQVDLHMYKLSPLSSTTLSPTGTIFPLTAANSTVPHTRHSLTPPISTPVPHSQSPISSIAPSLVLPSQPSIAACSIFPSTACSKHHKTPHVTPPHIPNINTLTPHTISNIPITASLKLPSITAILTAAIFPSVHTHHTASLFLLHTQSPVSSVKLSSKPYITTILTAAIFSSVTANSTTPATPHALSSTLSLPSFTPPKAD